MKLVGGLPMLLLFVACGPGSQELPPSQARLYNMIGEVFVNGIKTTEETMGIQEGDVVATSKRSRTTLTLSNEYVSTNLSLILEPGSQVRFEKNNLYLEQGQAKFRVQEKRQPGAGGEKDTHWNLHTSLFIAEISAGDELGVGHNAKGEPIPLINEGQPVCIAIPESLRYQVKYHIAPARTTGQESFFRHYKKECENGGEYNKEYQGTLVAYHNQTTTSEATSSQATTPIAEFLEPPKPNSARLSPQELQRLREMFANMLIMPEDILQQTKEAQEKYLQKEMKAKSKFHYKAIEKITGKILFKIILVNDVQGFGGKGKVFIGTYDILWKNNKKYWNVQNLLGAWSVIPWDSARADKLTD